MKTEQIFDTSISDKVFADTVVQELNAGNLETVNAMLETTLTQHRSQSIPILLTLVISGASEEALNHAIKTYKDLASFYQGILDGSDRKERAASLVDLIRSAVSTQI